MSNFEKFITPLLNKEMEKEIGRLSEESNSFYKEWSIELFKKLGDIATIKDIHLIVMRAIAAGLNAKTKEFDYTSAEVECSELSDDFICKLEELAELEAEQEAEQDLVTKKEAQAEAWDQMNRDIYEILSTELPERTATVKTTKLANEAISEGELTMTAISDTLVKAQRIVDKISEKKREVWSSKQG